MRSNLAKGATWAVKHKHKPGRVLSSSQKRHNKKYSVAPTKVEHAFRVIKCQFGSRKVRYRRLFKNTAQMFSLIVLANLDLTRRSLWTVSALNPKIWLKSPQKWAQKCGCRAWGRHLAISSPRRTCSFRLSLAISPLRIDALLREAGLLSRHGAGSERIGQSNPQIRRRNALGRTLILAK